MLRFRVDHKTVVSPRYVEWDNVAHSGTVYYHDSLTDKRTTVDALTIHNDTDFSVRVQAWIADGCVISQGWQGE